jgi:hypothetical protein
VLSHATRFRNESDASSGTILVDVVPVVSQRSYIQYSKNVKQPQNRTDNHDADQNPLNSVVHWNVFGGQPEQEPDHNQQNYYMNHEYRISTNGGLLG